MPILIAAAAIILLTLWRLWARDRAQVEIGRRMDPLFHRLFRRRPCRWQLLDGRSALSEFRCETCGVTAYSRSARGPAECKRELRNRV